MLMLVPPAPGVSTAAPAMPSPKFRTTALSTRHFVGSVPTVPVVFWPSTPDTTHPAGGPAQGSAETSKVKPHRPPGSPRKWTTPLPPLPDHWISGSTEPRNLPSEAYV